MKASKLLCIQSILFGAFLIGNNPVLAQVAQPREIRQWKLVPPAPNIMIAPGDEVYMSTNIEDDPFDGIYKVDETGMVRPKFCDSPVKIGGLSEAEASRIALRHTHANEVYNPKGGVRINVIRAKRP